MANSYFQFKQFRIEQGLCGMKVTTDACLFGAMVAESIKQGTNPLNILDIGTGTGLLALMLAQSSPISKIQALEIDRDTFNQASLNFQNSPWYDRLTINHSSLQDFKSKSQFDLIIVNPPFFTKNQLGESDKKNLAVHNESLTVDQLALGVAKHLSENGQLFILYPPYEMAQFTNAVKGFSLSPNQIIEIKDRVDKKAIRHVTLFSRVKEKTQTSELIIKQANNSYTATFVALLKPYYLHL